MRDIKWLLLLACLPILITDGMAQTKKYDLKSGIVTFETDIQLGKMKLTNKQVVYFDEYGMKERKEEYEDGTPKSATISDGKTLYKIVPAEKTAYKMGPAFRGTELKFDWNEVSEKDKKEGRAKKVANLKVAGKDCEAYDYDYRGSKTTFAGWKGICLYTAANSSGMQSVTKAIKIEENVPVPPEKFQIPEGYAVK